MKTNFNILNHLNESEIAEIVTRLGKEKLTITGHGFRDFGAIPIIEAANQTTINYTKDVVKKPAIGLLSVVLAANRNYNKVVEPNINRIEQDFPDLKTFQQLSEILNSKSEQEFFEFWGHKDKKKYKTLQTLLSTINNDLRKLYPSAKDDFEIMNSWGNSVDLLNHKQDLIGKIPNIAVATIQHLRMIFGVNTVKPDQRVKEVLDYEFGLSGLSDEKVIKAIEQIANIVQKEVITIDQIFVKYGSSYYNRNSNKLTVKQIAKNLKGFNVGIEIISKATLLSQKQIERL
jgi:hypothetical protein